MSEDNTFSNILQQCAPGSHDDKRRNGIVNHIQKVLDRHFKGSRARLGGNTGLGLSPRRAGIEIIVDVPDDTNLKQMANKLSWRLEGRGLEGVVTHQSRNPPTIHGRNDRTGIPVRLVIGDPTAQNQMDLISLVIDADKRIRSLLLAVNNWALHRNLGENDGGLSPFAWNILALTHLRRQGRLDDPFSSDSAAVVEVGERVLDVGLVNEASALWSGGDVGVEEMFNDFRTFLSGFSLPAKDVSSLRNPDGVKRVDVAFKAPDLGKLKKGDRTEYLWPILHPFDIKQDISQSLSIEGARRIIAEAGREVDDAEALFESVEGASLADDEDKDLFEDLRGLESHQVESMLKEARKNKTVIEGQVESLNQQRQGQIRIAQALRGLVKDTSGLQTDVKKLVESMPERRNEMNTLRQRRDSINERVVLPTKAIEEEIAQVYDKLTGEARSFRYPSPEEEARLFGYFLELQSMYRLAVESSECHQRLQELVSEQKHAVSELKSFDEEKDSMKEEALAGIAGAEEYKGRFHELKQIDRKISDLLRSLNTKRSELWEVNREIGRLDAWMRIQKKGGGRKRDGQHSGERRGKRQDRAPKVDMREVKRKAATGESMSLEDFGALLSSGGLSSVTPEEVKPSRSRRRKSGGSKKFGAVSGKRASGRPDLEGRGNTRR